MHKEQIVIVSAGTLMTAIVVLITFFVQKREKRGKVTDDQPPNLPDHKHDRDIEAVVRLFETATRDSVIVEPRRDAPFPTNWCFVRSERNGIIVKRHVNGKYAGTEEFIDWVDVIRRGMIPSDLHFSREGEEDRMT